MDDAYASFLRTQPPRLRDVGADLPARLGLTQPAEGWEQFIVLAPNRALPRFAVDGLDVDEETLDAYVAAHHLGAAFGLLADRMADGQAPPESALVDLRASLLRAWTEAIARACGETSLARFVVARALRAWRRGTAFEKRAFAARRLHPRDYAQLTRDKLRWFGAASQALLLQRGELERAQALERAYDRFSFALQCCDDAADCDEDEANRGISVPTMLGLPRAGLVRAASWITRDAAQVADAGGLSRLATWLTTFADVLDRGQKRGDAAPAQAELAGMMLAAAWRDQWSA